MSLPLNPTFRKEPLPGLHPTTSTHQGDARDLETLTQVKVQVDSLPRTTYTVIVPIILFFNSFLTLSGKETGLLTDAYLPPGT
jgi:hypothetical protein